MEEAFAQAYRDNIWHYGHITELKGVEDETRSGPGSTLRYTEGLRSMLPPLLYALGVRSLLDAPCGDYNWMRTVPLPGIEYIGADVVPEMIADLNTRHPNVDFRCLDVADAELPSVDFWLCRDVLMHLSDTVIFNLLRNWARSGIRYFATTHFFRKQDMPDYFDTSDSVELESSPFTLRFVNLMNPPFNLPPPEYMLKDYAAGFTRRWLAVWDRTALD